MTDVGDVLERIDSPSVGYVLGTRAFWFRRESDGVQRAPGVPETALHDAYEMHAFDGGSVWSWHRSPHGDGELHQFEVPNQADPIVRRTLLWGTVSQVEVGWARLAEARIQPFWVPVEASPHDQVALTRLEIITSPDAHGNVRVGAVLPVSFDVITHRRGH